VWDPKSHKNWPFIVERTVVHQRSMIEMLRPVDHQQKKYQYQKEEKK
jgi:hypothetical protein